MSILSEIKHNFSYRATIMPAQKKIHEKAPKTGDLAPDFTLQDVRGEESITLSNFRGKKPVALVFGSFT